MTTELYYLLFTAILTGSSASRRHRQGNGSRALKPKDYQVASTSPLPAWVDRANRAHMNALENFAPFAAVVLIAHAAGVSNSTTAISAAVYFYARAAHAVVTLPGLVCFGLAPFCLRLPGSRSWCLRSTCCGIRCEGFAIARVGCDRRRLFSENLCDTAPLSPPLVIAPDFLSLADLVHPCTSPQGARGLSGAFVDVPIRARHSWTVKLLASIVHDDIAGAAKNHSLILHVESRRDGF